MRVVESVLEAAYRSTGEKVATPKRQHRELVEDAKAYIGLHYTESLTLADVGQAVGASSFHLARLFRSLTGRTVHRHLTNIRLRAALGQLEDGAANITEIALGVGFASHSHLTKLFHERFGLTPSTFRTQSSAHMRRIVLA